MCAAIKLHGARLLQGEYNDFGCGDFLWMGSGEYDMRVVRVVSLHNSNEVSISLYKQWAIVLGIVALHHFIMLTVALMYWISNA